MQRIYKKTKFRPQILSRDSVNTICICETRKSSKNNNNNKICMHLNLKVHLEYVLLLEIHLNKRHLTNKLPFFFLHFKLFRFFVFYN